MPGSATDTGYDRGIVLAALYAAWTRELARHWPDGQGGCVCGGDVTPCAAEVLAMRQVRGVEVMWRREGEAVERRREAAGIDTSWASGDAAATTRPAPVDLRRWT